MKSVWFCIIIIFISTIVYAGSKTDYWIQEQLDETYMRSLSKNECMSKTINSLKVCNSDHCIKTMAGVTGDCLVSSSGKMEIFCKNYKEKYIKPYCLSKYFDDRTCRLFYAIDEVSCKKYKK